MVSTPKKLRLILPLTVFIVSAIVLSLIALTVYKNLRDDRRAGAEAGLKAVSKLKIGQLESWLAERKADINFLAKEIAHWHHEKWDGSGYPDGLAGDAIPVSARLMALADAFDALVSPRVYKAAMPFDQARGIIAEDLGKHFDPDMADAFLASFDVFTAIAQRCRDTD